MTRVVRAISAFVVCAAFAAAPCRAQGLGAGASVEKQEYRIGEWIPITVTVRSGAPLDSIHVAVIDSLGSLELLKSSRLTADDGTYGWQLTATSFDSGEVIVPPIPVLCYAKGDTAPLTVLTNRLRLEIASVQIDTASDIKDIKPVLNAPWTWEDVFPYLLVVAAAALLAAAIWYYRKNRKKTMAPAQEIPALPPHEEALMRLRALEEKKLWQQGRSKEYYSELTEIVRWYIERRFGIPALESTSTEIVEALREKPDGELHCDALSRWLEEADLVKFAKRQPVAEMHEEALKYAYQFVRGTRLSVLNVERPEPVIAEAEDGR